MTQKKVQNDQNLLSTILEIVFLAQDDNHHLQHDHHHDLHPGYALFALADIITNI